VKVAIIGAGYVGLVTGACLSQLGNEVTLVDVDPARVEAIRGGHSLIYEEGLDEILAAMPLRAGTDFAAIAGSEIIFICVGTPSRPDGSLSLDQIVSATDEIARVLKGITEYCVVTVKSTVGPGITEEIVIPGLEKSGKKAGADFGVCMAPEFLREGKAVYDFLHPARIIIGEHDRRSGDTLARLYEGIEAPWLRTDLRTAEMIKLASNSFLATKISFINEIGNICKQLGIDVDKVAEGMGYDERIGSKYLHAGLGFGGSCLPKDLSSLITRARQTGYEPGLLEAVATVNKKQAENFVRLAAKHVRLKGATIGVLGLSFKAGSDDIRDSRAIAVISALLREGAQVKAYDPLAADNFRALFPQVSYLSAAEVLDADAVLIVTEWEEFNRLDYRGKTVIDGRRVPRAVEAAVYEGLCW
jgi:UDPglucose 6-dehydrogenase